MFGRLFKRKSKVISRDGEADVYFPTDEEALAEATKVAISRLPEFINRLNLEAGTYFAVKVALPNSKNTLEHIWVDNLTHRDGKFFGKLANSPLDIPDMKLGSDIEISEEEIEDWVLMEGDDMVGGFSIAAIDPKVDKRMRK